MVYYIVLGAYHVETYGNSNDSIISGCRGWGEKWDNNFTEKTPARPLPFMVVLQKKHPRPSQAPCSGRSRRAQNRRPSPDSRGFYIYTIITVALYTNITLIMRLTDVTAFSWISYIFTTLSYVA
jgi:hypothetical protein